jgi:phospholipid/cholesterol/gamma-HCH transport system substrate-binding protein
MNEHIRGRAFREGSVGLMLLGGLGVLGVIFLWLKGLTPGSQRYNIIAQFDRAPGVQEGANVRLRGASVGRVLRVNSKPNTVDVTIEIYDRNLVIPRDSTIEINQAGLISENAILEISPRSILPDQAIAKPLESNCDSNLIICHNNAVPGQVGTSFQELLRTANNLIKLYSDPQIAAQLRETLRNTSIAASGVADLSRNFSSLPQTVKQELSNLSNNANRLTNSFEKTSNQINLVTGKFGTTADKFGTTADKINNATDQVSSTISKFNSTADKFGQTSAQFNLTAQQISTTAVEYRKLAISVNSLVEENRSTLNASLTNFNALTGDLRRTFNELNPTLARLNSTTAKLDTNKIVKDLEEIINNANQASANLRDLSKNLNDPQTLVLLRETLDSARITFKNTAKITSDLDDLTGDQKFRESFRQLVNGLGRLVSSTEQLEEQIKLAQTIEPINVYVNDRSNRLSTTITVPVRDLRNDEFGE